MWISRMYIRIQLPPITPYSTSLACHRAPSWALCAIQQLPLASYFTHGSVYMHISATLSVHSPLSSPLVCSQTHSLCLDLNGNLIFLKMPLRWHTNWHTFDRISGYHSLAMLTHEINHEAVAVLQTRCSESLSLAHGQGKCRGRDEQRHCWGGDVDSTEQGTLVKTRFLA